MIAEPVDAVAKDFVDVLERAGLHASLRFLNLRTRHRFTGVYWFDPPMLRTLCLFDRENPSLNLGGDTPMRETYCSLVGAGSVPFYAPDARADDRLAEHPARESVIAYCGVPLVGGDGRCVGSLCHFDFRPRFVPRDELPLLEMVAPVVLRACATLGLAA